MSQTTFLLYGANGYTGELIARLASQHGLSPILAGRTKAAIEALAERLQLPYLIFDLHDKTALLAALQPVSLVVHAAGPYDVTARPMIEACLETQTHYIDLNGDLAVFDMIRAWDEQAKAKGLMLLPGAGFDVVPTDCLAVALHQQMPDAVALQIAFSITGSRISRGTAITTLQQLGCSGAVRRNGQLVQEPVGKRSFHMRFPGEARPFFTMSIPWGDLSTAFFSTGIPDITTYTGISRLTWWFLKFQFLFNPLFRTRWMRNIMQTTILRLPAGPDELQRINAISFIQATATNAQKQSKTAYLRCPEAYSLTASSVVLITKKIMSGRFQPGYQTPASAYGADLVMEIPGVYREGV